MCPLYKCTLAPGLEGGQTLLGPAGQVDVHGGPHACPEVGGAGVEISVLGVQHELLAGLGLDGVADNLDAAEESQLVLFVDPDKEGLFIVVEDASSFGPVSVETNCFKEAISLFEKEVVGNELSLLLLGHGTK